MRKFFPTAVLLLSAMTASASEPLAIQDNSFLIEEAYNQEKNVVQHIFNYLRDRHGAYLTTFTQEWPVTGITHQFSYTIPMQRLSSHQTGIGDVLLNYRYQAVGDGNSRVAFAPRASLVVPSGSRSRGLGSGSWGLDTNLPLSIAISNRAVLHVNAGATKLASPDEPVSWSGGASLIAAPLDRFHLMLETRWVHAGKSVYTISPGVRWAHNLSSGLQIVPGIAFPISSDHTRNAFLYLSFEHPFRE